MKFKSTKYIFFLIILILSFCKQEGVYIEVDGEKLTESDLAKAMPERYNQLRKQYEEKVRELLIELAHQKMFEKEAIAKGITLDQYMQEIQNKAENPTQKEVDEFYNKMVETGQIKEKDIDKEDFKIRIFNYLKQGKIQEAFFKEIARLKQKYGYVEPFERANVNIQNEPFRGNPDGKIVIVEFSDFECPFCLKAQKTTRELREKYKDKIKWVFKDFPLDFHTHAMDAHIAANCVYKLKPEKFWDYYDALFSENRTKEDFKKESLEKKALAFGISQKDYRNCIANPEIKNEIDEDIKEGSELGVSGTPAFFINGRKLTGAVPISEFETIIQEELAN
ncbi:MAG: oxidoreductase [Leptospiraceae bacterium]|nr:MAG: oxidoreductase [Leptospiraceae bacterium]